MKVCILCLKRVYLKCAAKYIGCVNFVVHSPINYPLMRKRNWSSSKSLAIIYVRVVIRSLSSLDKLLGYQKLFANEKLDVQFEKNNTLKNPTLIKQHT